MVTIIVFEIMCIVNIMCIVRGGLETISLGGDGPVFDFAGAPDRKNLISIKGRWVLYDDQAHNSSQCLIPKLRKANRSLYNRL